MTAEYTDSEIRQRESNIHPRDQDPTPRHLKKQRITEHERQSTRRRSLFHQDFAPPNPVSAKRRPWTFQEDAALVDYVALYYSSEHGSSQWPSMHNTEFWSCCAAAVSEKTGEHRREGNACRTRVSKTLQGRFKTIDDAENHFNISYMDDFSAVMNTWLQPTSTPKKASASPFPSSPMAAFSPIKFTNPTQSRGEYFNNTLVGFTKLSTKQKISLLTQLFQQYLIENVSSELVPPFVPLDSIDLLSKALQTLKSHEQENTVYHLTKALGVKRQDSAMPGDFLSYQM
ncbi:uncharacterized protein [Ptychodera flava]|uniref:uncharacterized protein n=1 Tax=Ptychodera flava TaxID=63121 RepID=UPI003969C109